MNMLQYINDICVYVLLSNRGFICTSSPLDIISENEKIAKIDQGGVGIGNFVYVFSVLGVLGCMITLVVFLLKFLLSEKNGKGMNEFKTAVIHKLGVVAMIGCGVSFLAFVRKVAMALF